MVESVDLAAWEEYFATRVRGRRAELTSGYIRYVGAQSSKGLPAIFELRHLALLMGVDESFLVRCIQDSDALYRDFLIPKKRGGSRLISVPSPSLLFAQRWILSEILDKVDVSDCAFGFRSGRSVVDNARPHLGNNVLLKMDLSDFFPNIRFRTVMKMFLSLGYPVGVSYFLTALCCSKKRLPQGAATSPSISNIVFRRTDLALQTFATGRGLIYTRYADDLTFSGADISGDEIKKISFLVESSGFTVNHSKTRIVRGNGKRIVTGVSISSSKLALPRSTVRQIKSDVHALLKFGFWGYCESRGKMDPIIGERLMGRIGFWLQIDPENKTAIGLRAQLEAFLESINK